MKDLIRKTWLKFFEERGRRERLQKAAISIVLVVAVVSATVFVAVTPAHTLEAEASLSCGKEEHVHGEGCFTEQAKLTCGLEESAEEHTHTEECYGTESVLTCDLEEHSHGEECYTYIQSAETPAEGNDAQETQPSEENGSAEAPETPEEDVNVEETPQEPEETATSSEAEEPEEATPSEVEEATPSEVAEGDVEYSVTLSDGLVITMTGPADAFPEGNLTMRAEELHQGDADYEAALQLLAGETEGEVVLEQRIFDICLLDEDGNEVQPEKEVRVTFSQALSGEEQGVQIHHLNTEENVAEAIDTFVEGSDVVMETGHFSYYSMTLAGSGVATIGEKSYTTLTEAVKYVKTGETIVLQQDIEGESITISSTTCKNATGFTIDINGHTWTGKSNNPLITSTKAKMELTLIGGEGGTLQGNGKASDGGIIKSNGANTTIFIKDCRLTGGNASKEGGAIYIQDGNLTAEGCTFEENTSVNSGAIFVWGRYDNCSASFSGCLFLKNKVGNSSRGGGGAIIAASQGTKVVNLDINSCEFTENTSEKDGGAIYFNSEKGKITIAEKTTFLKNNTTRNGGAVCLNKGMLEINKAEFLENKAKASGGSLYVNYSSTISNAKFEQNQAERGGAIGVYFSKSNQTLKLDNVTVDGNTASNMGGAICDEASVSGATLEIKDCNIRNNVAGYTAGGIYSNSRNVFIIGTTVITQNEAEGDINKTSDDTKRIIGGVYLNSSLTPLSYKLDETAHVYKNKTRNEKIISETKPAEIYLCYKKGVNLEGFEGNTVTDSDTEYRLEAYIPTSGSFRYYYNNVTEPERIYLDPTGTHTHEENFIATTLEEAVALAKEKQADKIYICSPVAVASEDEANLNTEEIITFTRCDENKNYLFQVKSGSEVTFEKTRINGNFVEADYALVLVPNGTTLNIKGSTTIEAGVNANIGKDGGGGGLRVSGSLNMSGGTIQGNKAGKGGSGIYATGAKLSLTGGSILDNRGEGDGGGIYLSSGTLSITKEGEGRTLIKGNGCYGQGGGICLANSTTAEIYSADILNNFSNFDYGALDAGGGIYVDLRASLKMKNLYVTENSMLKKPSGSKQLSGAVYSCSTGKMAIFEMDGAYIADNPGAYDIHFSGNPNTIAYISSHVLGGSDAGWWGAKTAGPISNKLDLWGIQKSVFVYSNTEPGARDTAKVMAETDGVVMTGNWSYCYGSAIANNGRLVVGTEEMSLTVNKVWKDVDGNVITDTSKYEEVPENLRVSLMKSLNGKVPELATEFADAETQLNKGNRWSHTWERLGDSEAVKWSVEENKDDAAGFTTEISEKQQDTSWPNVVQKHYIITITNTEKDKLDIIVEKEWIDQNNAGGGRPDNITVQLLRNNDETTPFKTQELSVDNDWSYTFTDLPKYDDAGTKYVYSVKELPVENYTSEISEPQKSAQGTTYTITNTAYGKVQIKKTLDSYNATLGGAMFVFDVKATLEGKVIFNDVFTANFQNPGTQTIDVGVFPVGTTITVEEVYSGSSYGLTKGDKAQNLTIELNTAGTGVVDVLAEYVNAYDDKLIPGSGVRNHYEKNGSGWKGSQAAD